ncbi:hypothetical protein [Halobacillus sp. Cin3]|uniref:hypothetical protein n=1 Tax=Halobacillus sp. Cin3 TaxID=2928441 RepID=UPI00248D448A|nr:hypothetical protein [Halobacillus sp. Cin3]
MKDTIWTSEHLLTDQEVSYILQQIERDSTFIPERLVYYPYYFLEYEMKRGNWFEKGDRKIGYTIDSISGVGSLVDVSPELCELELKNKEVLGAQVSLSTAKKHGEKFVARSISYKLKVLKMPVITLKKASLFYRPYWIVEGLKKKKSYHLIVDALTGEFHPVGYQ